MAEALPPGSIGFDREDRDGSNVSGSALAQSEGTAEALSLAQCVEVMPESSYELIARVLVNAATGVAVEFSRFCETYAAPACADPVVGGYGRLAGYAGN